MRKLRDIEKKISPTPKNAVAKLVDYKARVTSVKKTTQNLTFLLQHSEDEVQALISDASTNDRKAAKSKLGALKGEVKYIREQADEISRSIDNLR